MCRKHARSSESKERRDLASVDIRKASGKQLAIGIVKHGIRMGTIDSMALQLQKDNPGECKLEATSSPASQVALCKSSEGHRPR